MRFLDLTGNPDFIANGALTSLSFLGFRGTSFIGLDNVAVESVGAADPADAGAVPEPDALR